MKAITGVINTNDMEHIGDELTGAIDLDFENHLLECKNEYHDDCWYSDESTYLIGFKKGRDGKWAPDRKAEWSAIVNGGGHYTTQVVRSRWYAMSHYCSPCYPGQGDLNTPGALKAYAPPPDIFGEYGDQDTKKRIKPLYKKKG